MHSHSTAVLSGNWTFWMVEIKKFTHGCVVCICICHITPVSLCTLTSCLFYATCCKCHSDFVCGQLDGMVWGAWSLPVMNTMLTCHCLTFMWFTQRPCLIRPNGCCQDPSPTHLTGLWEKRQSKHAVAHP